jgi:hypothetical protein
LGKGGRVRDGGGKKRRRVKGADEGLGKGEEGLRVGKRRGRAKGGEKREGLTVGKSERAKGGRNGEG